MARPHRSRPRWWWLRREKRRPEMENEIPRRAAAHFAAPTLPKIPTRWSVTRRRGIRVRLAWGARLLGPGLLRLGARPGVGPGLARRVIIAHIDATATIRRSATGSSPTSSSAPASPSASAGCGCAPSSGCSRPRCARVAIPNAPDRRARRPPTARLHRRGAEPEVGHRHHRAPHRRRGQGVLLRGQDLFSNRIVGYAVSERMTADLARERARSPAPPHRCRHRPRRPGRPVPPELPAVLPEGREHYEDHGRGRLGRGQRRHGGYGRCCSATSWTPRPWRAPRTTTRSRTG